MEKAILAGGCFWCTEAVFQNLKGVEQIVSGYTDGKVKNPTYKEVCSGLTGHTEAIEITFDPEIITFGELLEIFWTTHDPTTLNRQGNDVGTQYRSGIYYLNEGQREIAEHSMREVATKIWDDPIVTELKPASTFYPAEKYHQDYYNRNSYVGYCRIVISPKIAKVKEKFKDKLKTA
jgi:peptide-methionine (S)-S-oxide reductase